MDLLKIAIEAARRGGEAILANTDQTSTTKKDGTPLTQADIASRTAIVDFLAKESDDPIIAEEQENPTINWRTGWIVDPLDGSGNYRIGNPGYAVNVAYLENGELSLGVMYFPVLDKIVIAERSTGEVTINGNKCQPFAADSLGKRRLGLDLHRRITDDFFVKIIGPLIRKCERYPRNEPTSMSLLDLLEGTTDIYISNNQAIWDPAAGAVALLALGGEIFTLDGSSPTWDQVRLPTICYTRSKTLKKEVLAALNRTTT